MNANLKNAINDIAKVNGILYSMESAFGGIHFAAESLEEASHCINTFYALIDAAHKVEEDLERLAEDSEVVDVILAARKMHLDK